MINRREVEILIKNNIDKLNRNQVKTLKGQLNKGEIVAAKKGLDTILRKYNKRG